MAERLLDRADVVAVLEFCLSGGESYSGTITPRLQAPQDYLEALRNQARYQDTALHRLPSTWLATRAARINTVRGLRGEFGLVIRRARYAR